MLDKTKRFCDLFYKISKFCHIVTKFEEKFRVGVITVQIEKSPNLVEKLEGAPEMKSGACGRGVSGARMDFSNKE